MARNAASSRRIIGSKCGRARRSSPDVRGGKAGIATRQTKARRRYSLCRWGDWGGHEGVMVRAGGELVGRAGGRCVALPRWQLFGLCDVTITHGDGWLYVHVHVTNWKTGGKRACHFSLFGKSMHCEFLFLRKWARAASHARQFICQKRKCRRGHFVSQSSAVELTLVFFEYEGQKACNYFIFWTGFLAGRANKERNEASAPPTLFAFFLTACFVFICLFVAFCSGICMHAVFQRC